MSETFGVLVILTSPNGIDGWTPVKPDDVPSWVKDPDIVARMVDGEACMDDTQESGTNWFLALPMPTPQDIAAYQAAQIRRAERRQKRIVVAH